MRFILLLSMVILFCGMTSCASRPNIQQDCELMGNGPFSQCKSYPWYKRGCERFE